MKIYEKLKECPEEDLFELVMSDADLETDGTWGIIENYKSEYPELSELYNIIDEGDRIKEIDRRLKGRSVLFVSQSHGNDDLIFKIDSDSNIEKYNKIYGYSYAVNYIPVCELPNLWNTPGNLLDIAIDKYASSKAQGLKAKAENILVFLNRLEDYLSNSLLEFVFLIILLFAVVIKVG